MAKQAVGKIERHLEKGVLAVAGLVFLAAVGRYLATTPNKIELTPGEFVTPDKIDDQIYEQADRARLAIQAAKPDAVEAVSVTPKFEAALDPLKFAQLPAALPRGVPFLPVAPLISTHRADGTIELVPAAALDKPVLAAGRSRLAFEQEPIAWNVNMDDKDDFPETSEDASWPVNWVTVSAVWNRQAQMDLNEKAYGKGRAYALLGGVEVQRRARRADGTFSDEDWQTIEPYVRAKLPDAPELLFGADTDGKAVATSENLSTATKVYTIVQDPVVQMNLLRPIVQPPLSGDTWKFPAIANSDPVEQDDEFFRPDVDAGFKPSRAIMKDRYPRTKEESKALDLPWINGRRPTQEEARTWKVNFPLAKEAYIKALKENDPYIEANAYNFVVRVHDMESSCQKVAQELLKEFDDLKAKMTVKPPPRPGPKPTAPTQATPEVVPHPKFPMQQVWVIDANIDSVMGGRSYQYRIRPLLFNPFYGQPKALKNPADARLPYIRGEWSSPSDPIYIEPDTQFFARSTTKERGEVSFDMYKWVEGNWVKATAKVGYGDVVACDSKVDVSDTKKELVQFNGDALFARLDTNRPWCDVGRAGKSGVKFGAAQPTESIALVDASGNVVERLLDLDRSDPKGKDLQGKLFKPQPKKVETAPKTGPPGAQPGRNVQRGNRGALSGNPYGEPMSDEAKQRMKEEEEARKAGGRPPRP